MKKPFESSLFQINLGKRRAAAYNLQVRTRDMKRFIALIQEPWMVKGKPAGLEGQHALIYANCAEDKPSRARIYSHTNAKVAPCPAFTGRDVACGLWDVGMPNLQQVMLVSIYWDGKFSELPQKFLDCLKWCRANKIPVHIGGDFNSHSTLWGGRRDSWRGDLILRLIPLLGGIGIADHRGQ